MATIPLSDPAYLADVTIKTLREEKAALLSNHAAVISQYKAELQSLRDQVLHLDSDKTNLKQAGEFAVDELARHSALITSLQSKLAPFVEFAQKEIPRTIIGAGGAQIFADHFKALLD